MGATVVIVHVPFTGLPRLSIVKIVGKFGPETWLGRELYPKPRVRCLWPECARWAEVSNWCREHATQVVREYLLQRAVKRNQRGNDAGRQTK